MTDAFGVVAMGAMTPLITLQVLGLVYRIRGGELGEKRKEEKRVALPDGMAVPKSVAELYGELGDEEIIEL